MVDSIILDGEGLDSPLWERTEEEGYVCSEEKTTIIMSKSELVQVYRTCNGDATDPEICKSCVLRDIRWNGAWVYVGNENRGCWSVLEDAITKILDRNIPLKPVEADEWHKATGYRHDCPKCGYSLGYKEKCPGILPRWLRKTILYEHCQPYCGFCGQAIDWTI